VQTQFLQLKHTHAINHAARSAARWGLWPSSIQGTLLPPPSSVHYEKEMNERRGKETSLEDATESDWRPACAEIQDNHMLTVTRIAEKSSRSWLSPFSYVAGYGGHHDLWFLEAWKGNPGTKVCIRQRTDRRLYKTKGLMRSSELAREKMWSRIHLIPLLTAEEDRDLVRRHLADQAREKELLGKETSPYNSDR